MKGLHDSKGSVKGMQFLFEIDEDNPEGKARSFRWSSEEGEEPDVWIWRSGDEQADEHEAGDGIWIDRKVYDGAKDA